MSPGTRWPAAGGEGRRLVIGGGGGGLLFASVCIFIGLLAAGRKPRISAGGGSLVSGQGKMQSVLLRFRFGRNTRACRIDSGVYYNSGVRLCSNTRRNLALVRIHSRARTPQVLVHFPPRLCGVFPVSPLERLNAACCSCVRAFYVFVLCVSNLAKRRDCFFVFRLPYKQSRLPLEDGACPLEEGSKLRPRVLLLCEFQSESIQGSRRWEVPAGEPGRPHLFSLPEYMEFRPPVSQKPCSCSKVHAVGTFVFVCTVSKNQAYSLTHNLFSRVQTSVSPVAQRQHLI